MFYEGHLPAFSFNTLVKRGLGKPSIDAALERCSRAASIRMNRSGRGRASCARGWPSRDTVRQFADEADRQVIEALADGDIEQPGHPLLDRAEAAFCILEHEAMHQETLLYMWHRLPLEDKPRPDGYRPNAGTRAAAIVDRHSRRRARRSASIATRVRFSWDNERPAYRVRWPAFQMQQHNVTNADFLEFVEAGGYGCAVVAAVRLVVGSRRAARRIRCSGSERRGTWMWRGMFDACRCRWRGRSMSARRRPWRMRTGAARG